MERSEIRGLIRRIAIPDCAALHPGYRSKNSLGGIANGSRECAPDDKLRVFRQFIACRSALRAGVLAARHRPALADLHRPTLS
jgi:hypothetical protein